MGGHSDRVHKKYSPSQMERIFLCPGSVKQLERVPARVESSYAIEGTKAHEILDAALQNGERRAVRAHREHSIYLAEDFDDDFFYSIQVALNYIYGILDEFPDAVLYHERYVEPPTPSAPGEGGGFCDVAIHVPSLRTLFSIDYKHGAGYAKEVRANPQPKQYAAGFLYGEPALVDPATVDTVTCAIIQPRAFHIDGPEREHSYTPYEIYEYLDELDEGIRISQAPNAPLVPEEKPGGQCTFCDARTFCPAREAKALSGVSETFKTVYDIREPGMADIKTMDLTRLAYIVKWKPYLERYLNDAQAHLKELMEQGYAMPEFKLVEASPRRVWYGPEHEVAGKIATLAKIPITDVYRQNIMGITEAERLIVEAFKANVGRGKKKQAAEDAMQAFALLTVKQSSGNISVAPMDDPRPPVNRAATAFSGIGGLLAPPSTEK